MNQKTIVCCHSPSLAYLLFETNCSNNNQIGFLLGNVKNQVIMSTTDENESSEEAKTIIYIEHCIPMPQKFKFDNYGHLDKGLLKFCEPIQTKIIGWYSFRRNFNSNHCSLRETMIHKNFLRSFKILEPENFVVGLLSAISHTSTHDFNYNFLRFSRNMNFEVLKLKIYCLSDKTSGYITNSIFPISQDFRQIESSLHHRSAIDTVNGIHKSANEILTGLNVKLQKLEEKRSNLENDVNVLRKQLLTSDSLNPNLSTIPKKKEPIEELKRFDPKARYAADGANPINADMYDGKKMKNTQKKEENEVSPVPFPINETGHHSSKPDAYQDTRHTKLGSSVCCNMDTSTHEESSSQK